jgi:Fic family protein
MATILKDTIQDSEREFRTSHPWIKFDLDLRSADRRFWQMVGEARSKCRHLMLTPLKPAVAQRLEEIYLAKGMQATTAIEGNTLTLDQVKAAVDGTLTVPPSQQYLKQEIDNVLRACGVVEENIRASGGFEVSVRMLKDLNRIILDDLELEDHVIPGEFRDVGVGVGSYRGAPPRDVEFLTTALCDWLNGPDFDLERVTEHRDAFLHAFLKAAVAHLYIAWIHPFGDGNGRTARLIEFGVLSAAGIPSVAAHLLSNHYNMTRAAYYRQLDQASKSGGDLCPFLRYAAEGFVDQLQEQLNVVHKEIFHIAWENYVHEHFGRRAGEAAKRQREVVIALGLSDTPVPRDEITLMTPRLAGAYGGRQTKTLTRDINRILESGLVRREKGGFLANKELMYGFTPRIGGEVAHNVLVDFVTTEPDLLELVSDELH